jgi:hypothetical protein
MLPEWLQESPPQRPSYVPGMCFAEPSDSLWCARTSARSHWERDAARDQSPDRIRQHLGRNVIGAWALIGVMHAIIAGIASLILQLLAEDDDIRPASEVRWSRRRRGPRLSHQPSRRVPGVHRPLQRPQATADPLPINGRRPLPPKGHERVSWQTAAQAAWLARPATTRAEDPSRRPMVVQNRLSQIRTARPVVIHPIHLLGNAGQPITFYPMYERSPST